MNAQATPVNFPTDVLRPSDATLSLFVAAFGGRQDCAHLRDAGVLAAMCVDNDREKLDAMRGRYPESWTFVCGDGFEFIDNARGKWDVLTLDPWGGEMQGFVRERLPKLLAMTRRTLILGVALPSLAEALVALARLGRRDLRVIVRSENAVWVVVSA